jgi:hypothetical protein
MRVVNAGGEMAMAKAETDTEDGTGTENGDGDNGEPGQPEGEPEASIADQADELEERLGQLPIPGTISELSLNAGGESPETASLKLLGGTLPVEGEFDKGDLVRVWVEGRVTEVAFVDHLGKDGYVEATERRHKVRMVRVRRVEE